MPSCHGRQPDLMNELALRTRLTRLIVETMIGIGLFPRRIKIRNFILTVCVSCLLIISIHDFVALRAPRPYDDLATFKKYDFGFFFPLEIDLRRLVENKIVNNTDIDYAPINKHNFKYIHQPPDCDFTSKYSSLSRSGKRLISQTHTRLLILVKSAINNDRLRMTIRMSWGKNVHELNSRLVFLLATSKDSARFVDLEAKTYNDIIQEDFMDSYYNNTLKIIMGYNWAVKHCSQAKYFLFVDDDHFVNLPQVQTYIHRLPRNNPENVFLGLCIKDGYPSRISDKWFISKDDYPFHHFPPYLGGGAFLTSYSCALRFVTAFPYVQFFWIDDVYLGIVAAKLGIVPRHDSHFQTHEHDTSLDTGFVSHFNNHNADDMLLAWQKSLKTRS